ncbi:apical membrane antigen 1, putative [Eimeria brunetti]|uniref:Apical membrane antigen 1, putative n=1 Tax=Eimeria brunetti TaxID=51314 RepID=U6LBB9_9EIME|nr:apical membrane antigen 1, putative [Eimeria brunetti]
MCRLRTAAITGAVLGLLSAGLPAARAVKDLVHQQHYHQHHSRAAAAAALHPPAAAGVSAAATSLVATQQQQTPASNPFLEPPLDAYMERFNIPLVHGSGIYVDLGSDKEVDGRQYREPGGRCPVFGKTIKLHQPKNNPSYKNDYLQNVPTKAESDAAGHPLPGGLNNNFVLTDKTPFSPMSVEKLSSYKELKAKTGLGKCAEMSYKTTASRNSSYRYPFAFDTRRQLCYFLLIPVQRLMGERYCSVDGKPAGMTWYCMEPSKSAEERTEMVYGSAYVGERPDEWEEKCPNKATKNAVFGVWKQGKCVEHKFLEGSKVEKVKRKEECWELAFLNPEVASDHPVTDDENIGTVGYYFPTVGPNQPKSGGTGMNFASFYPHSECVLSSSIPTCLVPLKGAAAYTALGGLEEEEAPCDRSNAMVIGLAAAGGILLLLLTVGGIAVYRGRAAAAKQQQQQQQQQHQQQQQQQQQVEIENSSSCKGIRTSAFNESK